MLHSVPTRVFFSKRADQQHSMQRKKDRERVADFVSVLKANGCKALGYRLTGTEPIGRLCVRHLGRLRVVVAFADPATAWVLLIGPHDDKDHGIDIYTELYRLVGFAPQPGEKRTKPPCCDESGTAPLHDQAEILVDRATMLRRTRG